jgi:D-alanine-D-alanine ligase
MRIGVICGGFGPERSISLKSGKAVFHSLREGGKDDILCLDPAGITLNRQNETVFSDSDSIDEKANRGIAYRDCLQRFRDFRAEIIFIALHGSDGEDGHLQALLDMLGVAYTGSGPLACQLSMDKDIAKRLAGFGGVRTADWVMLDNDTEFADDAIANLGLPLVIKSNTLGSSVGLMIIKDWQDFRAAVSRSFTYDSLVMAEKYIAGRELTVSILEGEPLPVVEIVPRSGIYDFKAKYSEGESEYFCPADVPQDVRTELYRYAQKMWQELRLSGYARVDFRLDPDNQAFFLEVNTLPGLSKLSLLPMAARTAGIDFSTLLKMIIAGTMRRFNESGGN